MDSRIDIEVFALCVVLQESRPKQARRKIYKVVLTKLFHLDEVIVTPHVAGWTHESLRKIAETLLVKIRG